MNKKREHNRRMSHREPEHMEKGHKAEMRDSNSSGSPYHGERVGAGEVPGAGELTWGSGPGRAAMGVRSNSPENPVRATPKGSAPKGMSVYKEGS